ncbi:MULTISPECIES: DMT family transporter [unclassified Pseudomonas]|uniref:DMT family transporter n=1 Tax=unclassified Pseudomonas TaxID=196821 RepID=UPI000BDD7D21|nr:MULTISPECIES: DMT family transporter [unclassified Pseudomonas]PVZ20723.1 threonine/homoserine efflux transporter RhtA [Pseudomonas sp. URIL14HWK12:I12]PVZ27789.1 threonine/homoserine efflux transporter RhtA [Pseudomonas sp. URIL14HWK12:I10]PVZ38678.1 threonine/homoserine efflux transporter RhtA [Pseudomonas sp. URIL14HWK12:I11]SNZ02401.1 Threonine/homoserine efflux transporter RhtA [Pseudomonas sp. URIL14HWK12:I9]
MHRSTLRTDALMLLTALIWGSAFVMQQQAMEHIGPFLYSGLRFILGALCLLPLVLRARPSLSHPTASSRWPLRGGATMGLVLACGINLQQVGLLFTTVTNSGFITGLYVIIVPLVGLAFGQRAHSGTWLGAAAAVLGMALLSVGDGLSVAWGDLLQLAGAFAWAGHVLLVGALANRHDPLRLAFVQFVVCGLVSLLLALLLEPWNGASIAAAIPALLYGGVVAVALGFTLQVISQKGALPSHAAVIFSLEAVFAAIAGAIFLGESLSVRGYLGCGLMLAGMLLAQLWPKRPSAA